MRPAPRRTPAPGDLARRPVDDADGLAGVIDEGRLAGAVRLPHHHIDLSREGPVVLAEPAVAEAVRMRCLVFLLQQGRVEEAREMARADIFDCIEGVYNWYMPVWCCQPALGTRKELLAINEGLQKLRVWLLLGTIAGMGGVATIAVVVNRLFSE